MAKIYVLPERSKPTLSKVESGKVIGKAAPLFTLSDFIYYMKRYAANALHYPVIAFLLLVKKIRHPVAIVGGGYCLHFLSTHHNSLWVNGNYSAVYSLLAVIFVLLSVVAVKWMESALPFHRLFRAFRSYRTQTAANDDYMR